MNDTTRSDSTNRELDIEVDAIVASYESDFRSGKAGDLSAYLPERVEVRQRAAARLVEADLELRFSGKSIGVGELDSYLSRFPEIQEKPVLVELIGLIKALAAAHQQPFPKAEFCRRFPEIRDEIEAFEAPVIPGFEMLGRLGRGAMGVVYKARHIALDRVIAVKTMRAGADATLEEVARFQAEAKAVAALSHPNIVQIYESGTHGKLAWFALEYCDGGTLAEFLRTHRVPPAQAAELIEALARAVHAAHTRGIVHRDLKPGNILLVGARQSLLTTDQLKIADFGLAKKIGSDSDQTRTGAVLGTPSYMAPEQAAGKPSAVGPLADVYALGAILYELLTGEPPFHGETTLETLDKLRSLDPVPPRRRNGRIPRDLETICLKCLEKAPGRRYGSALELADDLRRMRELRPIVAKPAGLGTRTVKWLRRHPAWAAVGVFLPVLALATGVAWLGFHLAGEQKKQTDSAKQVARTKDESLETEKTKTDLEKQRVKEQKDLTRREQYFRTIAQCDIEAQRGNRTRLLALLNQCPKDLRGWEWFRLRALAESRAVTIGSSLHFASISADAKAVLSGKRESISAFDADGKATAFIAENGMEHTAAAFDRAGKKIAIGVALPARERRQAPMHLLALIYDNSSGAMHANKAFLHRADAPFHTQIERVRAVAVSPDGRWLAVGGQYGNAGTLQIWDIRTEKLAAVLPVAHHFGLTALAFSPDGERIATAGGDGFFRICQWDGRDLQRGNRVDVKSGKSEDRERIEIRPDKKPILITGRGDDAKLLSVSQPTPIQAIEFSPDGNALLTSGQAGLLKLWNASDGKLIRQFHGHVGDVTAADFNSDGAKIASGSSDGTIRLWDTATGGSLSSFLAHSKSVLALRFAAGDQEIASVGEDGALRNWRTAQSEQLAGHRGPVTSAVFRPDGDEIISHSTPHGFKHWSTVTGKQIRSINYEQVAYEAQAVRFDFPCSRFVVQDGTTRATVRDAANAKVLFVLEGHSSPITAIVQTVSGDRIVTGDQSGIIKIWSGADGQLLDTLEQLPTAIRALAISADGKRIVSGGDDHAVRLWNCAERKVERVLTMPGVGAICVALSQDNQLVCAGGKDGKLKLWDLKRNDDGKLLEGHLGDIHAIAFSPDGSRLISGSSDAKVKVWDTFTGLEALTLHGHTGAVLTVAFSPDGKRALSAGQDEVIRI